MDRQRIKSANLYSVGHDETGLTVQFHAKGCGGCEGAGCGGGNVFNYPDVPKDMHVALLNVDSPGRYFHFNIKAAKTPDNQVKYPGRRV
jgi:hypothetical protein